MKILEFKTDLYKTFGFDFLEYNQEQRNEYTEEARLQYSNQSGFNAVHVDDDYMLSFSAEKNEWVIHSIIKGDTNKRSCGKYSKSFDDIWVTYCVLRGFDMD